MLSSVVNMSHFISRLRPPHYQLFCLGFLTLFLELALIRYLAGTIWNLGYFPNLVLIAVFLGMGIGFIIHNRWTDYRSLIAFSLAPALLAGLILLVYFFHPALPGFTQWTGQVGEEIYFTNTPTDTSISTPSLFFVWFITVVILFALIAQRAGRMFQLLPPLEAYTMDILGSCCGIILFIWLSWFQLGPPIWYLILIPLFLLAAPLTTVRHRWLVVAPFGLIFLLLGIHHSPDGKAVNAQRLVRWSPYQKVELVDGRTITVNGIGHQGLRSLDDIRNSFYQMAYTTRATLPNTGPYKNVLVLGAGVGNDVVAALENGAEHVDAVEIDPAIAEFGRQYHPALPYSDPRVNLIIDDGRAFMTRTTQRYDLIVFALTDSLVKVSPVSQLRLENYLFTREAIIRANNLLTVNGDLLFYNFYRRPWIQDKIKELIAQATGADPIVLSGNGDFAVLIAGALHQGTVQPRTIDIPTDDWPFLYMHTRHLPALYAWAMVTLSIIVVSALIWMERRSAQLSTNVSQPLPSFAVKMAFLLMGIAFLLLETKSVIQFSLLFGTTWLNNSLVFLAILLLILAANWTATILKKVSLVTLYALLLISSLATIVYPLGNLLHVESFWLRFVMASLLTFLPIFFANLIFSTVFRGQKMSAHVFGWNLIGATLGGVLEYFSVVTGYSALAWIVIACYTLVFLLLVGQFGLLKNSFRFQYISQTHPPL